MAHETARQPTAPGGEPHFALECDPLLLGFERLEVTAHHEFDDGYRIPTEVRVIFPDGSALEDVPADTPAFTLRALHRVHGLDIVVPIERAWHIKHLHLDGAEPGSVFTEGETLETTLTTLCEVLPLEASEGNFKRQAFNIDVGHNIGYENLGSLAELKARGVITGVDERIIASNWRRWVEINLAPDDDKQAYVREFNEAYADHNIFLGIMRPPHNVVLPLAVGDTAPTTRMMTALSTRWQEGGSAAVRKMHTYTPGRQMERHPIPGEHRDPVSGRIVKKSIRSAMWHWSQHILLVPSRSDENPAE